jgi:hypothetical protein
MKYLGLVYLPDDAVSPPHGGAEASTIVRVRSGRLSVTERPRRRGGECPTGYFLIEAVDLNEAIVLASRCPSARIGDVELQPINVLDEAGG